MKGKVIISNTFDPAYNLGLEEYLIELGQDVLYLWQNDNTIVIGRNQNPYKECNISRIDQDEVKLVRRRSGGGAVFHDRGNLNFTIISRGHEAIVEENFNMVTRALAHEGIQSKFNGRNDLDVDGRKISGNAFYQEEDIFCHHGTLLVDVDMDKLSSYLTASKLKLESKGIDSVRSRVINLRELREDISIDSIKDSFIKSYGRDRELGPISYLNKEDMDANPAIRAKVDKYRSWEWTYGESPESNISIERKFSWGIVSLEFFVEDGITKKSKVFTDSIINDKFDELGDLFIGREFTKDILIEVIENNLESKLIREDLIREIRDI